MQVVKIVGLHAADLVVLFWLAGCVPFEARPLSPDQTAARFEARTLDDPGLQQFLEENLQPGRDGGPRHEWDLDTLTLAAFYYQPDLEVARARWAVARAGIQTAGQRPNPTLNVGPQYTSNAESGVSPWVVPLTVEATLETAGKRGYRIARATQESESARLTLVAQAWQVRSRLRARLLDDTAARRRVVLLQNVQGIEQEILKLLEGRLAAGAIATTELTTARVALLKTHADLADAQRQAVESRAGVAEALGVPLRAIEGRELKFDLSAPPEAAGDLESAAVRRQALLGRADIRAVLADYAASQSTLQLEIAKQYPDLRLGPGYEYDQGEHKWGLGVGLELPVFHRNQGPIAEAQAERAEAAARFLALQAQVIAALDRALAARTATLEQSRQIDDLLEAQRRHVQSVDALVKAGGADQYDLRSAQLEVALAEVTHLDALLKAQQALGQLEDAVQVPFEALASVEQNRHLPGEKEKKP